MLGNVGLLLTLSTRIAGPHNKINLIFEFSVEMFHAGDARIQISMKLRLQKRSFRFVLLKQNTTQIYEKYRIRIRKV